MNAVQSAMIADTSSMSVRSFYIGLVWIMYWTGSAISPLAGAALMEHNLYVENFGIAVAIWLAYLLYLKFVVPETLSLSSDVQSMGAVSTHSTVLSEDSKISSHWPGYHFLQEMWQPLPLIFGNPVLRWLAIAAFFYQTALGTIGLLVPYCDTKFGLGPQAVGHACSLLLTSLRD